MSNPRTRVIRGRPPCRTCRMAMGLDVDPQSASSVSGVLSGASATDDTECPCIVSVAIMRELGMMNAANMHAQAAGEGGGAPTVQGAELHMGDEESTLFPTLRRVAKGIRNGKYEPSTIIGAAFEAAKLDRDVNTLETQHGVFRRDYLSKGIVPPLEVLGPHGKAEDKIVSKYADLIRLEWQNMRAAKIAGVSL